MTAYRVANRNVNCAWCKGIATHEATLTETLPPRGSLRQHKAGTTWPACQLHAGALRSDNRWRVPFIPAADTVPVPDKHGNIRAREGLDRCPCGAKYWENDRCVSCGDPFQEATVNA